MATFMPPVVGFIPDSQIFDEPMIDVSEEAIDDEGLSFSRRLLKRHNEDGPILPRKRRKPGDPIPAFKPQNPINALISNLKDAPPGWDPNDGDIDESDIDGMIQRCEDRIKDQILPQIWERKLQVYKEYKEQLLEVIKSEDKELSIEVVIRLKRLEIVKKRLIHDGDKYNSLPNIEAIMRVYRSRDYKWEQDKATFWSKGELVDGPVDLDSDKFLDLSSKYNPTGRDGFWVELHNVPGPGLTMISDRHEGGIFLPDSPTLVDYRIAFRVPGSNPAAPMELNVVDDTGADCINIYEDDLNNIVSLSGVQFAPFIASNITNSLGGLPVHVVEVALDVAYVDTAGNRVTGWCTWPVNVHIGISATRPRIGGPFLRSLFYVGSAPELPHILYNASSRDALAAMMPTRSNCDTRSRTGGWRIGLGPWPHASFGQNTINMLRAVDPVIYMPPKVVPKLPGPGPQPQPGGRGA